MNNDYGVKRALIEEYKKVLEFKKMYEELIESFRCIIGDLFEYSDKHRIDLPNRDRIYRNMEKAKELIEYRIAKSESLLPTESQQRNKTPDKPTEP
jgi:hypothetical protein